MTAARDYKVRPRTETEIKKLADRCRFLGGIDKQAYFNIIQYLRRSFRSSNDPRKQLRFATVPECHSNEIPYVEYDPLTLVSTQRLINKAETGDAFARFQFAHETGHIVMHDHHAKSFSNDKNIQISFCTEIYSAEWQANTFAEYFLLPDWIFYVAKHENEILERTRIPAPLLEERLEDMITLSAARGVIFSWGDIPGAFAF